jgi:hypothetical protein
MIHNNVTKGYRFKITLITLLEFNGVPLVSEGGRPSQAGGIEAGGCYLWALRAVVTVADYAIAAIQAWLLHRRALG